MAISYPITLPSGPSSRSITIVPKDAVAVTASTFTYSPQVQAWSGQMWTMRFTLPPGKRNTMAKWVAALTSLRGPAGSFLAGDFAHPSPRGVGTGTPLVNGGGQLGTTLNTDGWTPSTTGILKAGDYIQLGSGSTSRLYMNLTDVNSNGSGQAALELWPSLRTSPADNAAIVINNPRSKFMLTTNVAWNIDEAKVFGIDFQAVEDLR